ncbi:DUF1000-domain-containing protein [Dacryopinax primogenitus]|uniref:DUF1000-domain-containing protein n=1 Tax=Dacryopinax primogenitus (strain DJM 731) TaxID=1858805 RepID=M5G2J3_DACPD|nr:DUF1000-domain-containing protein [Dacryopinax primogenitus]EJU02435.1 DUF1000-domain-containing protein [Dacryopinax primogenitus]
MPTCQDDLTAVDVAAASPSVQQRITAGAAETINLFGAIDRDNVFGVNISVPEDAKEVIKPWHERDSMIKYAESNVDDQLIIHVPFVEQVRIRSIFLKPARGDFSPQRLRVYLNRPAGIDFNDVDSLQPAQDIALLEGAEGVTEYPVRVAAFANVNSCTLLFSDTPTDVSRIYYIGFKGERRSPHRDPNTRLDIPAAQGADAPVDRLAEKSANRQNTIR